MGEPDTDVEYVTAWKRGKIDVVLQKDSPADGAYVWVPCTTPTVDIPLPATLYMPGKSRHSGVDRRSSLATDRLALRFHVTQPRDIDVLDRWLAQTHSQLK